MAGKRRRRVRDAVHAAEAETGVQFCVYLGPAPGDTRELAIRLFTTAEGHPGVLIAVSTSEHRIEILTADWLRPRLPDAACEHAIDLMRPALQQGAYDDALVIGIRHLAEVAGSGAPSPGGVEVPDLFDES